MQRILLDRRYEIIRPLGRGYFGETFLAQDNRRMGRQCVVKHLQPGSNDPYTLHEAKLLFESEAISLEKLGKHDQIPDLFDYFQEENGEFYLVQEFIEGYPLHLEILPNKKLAENQVIDILKDVLGILSFVHNYQVIHRDIKPSNLMRRHKDQKIILIDFGAVKQVRTQIVNAQGQTCVTRIVGTPGYMPNEQLKGKPQFSSDIYALGVTAIEALTGVPPNQLQEDPRTTQIIWRDQAQVSSRLADILDKMVRSHWMQRYQSAEEVLKDLKNLPYVHTLRKKEPTYPRLFDRLRNYSQKLLIVSAILICGLGGLVGSRYFVVFLSNQAHNYFQQGIKKAETGDLNGAMANYTQTIQLNPNYTQAYKKRGDVLYNQGYYQEAVEDYTKVIRLNPKDDKAYNHLGNAHSRLQDYKQALEDYTQAIKLNPKYAQAYNGRGNAHFNLGDKQAAIEDYSKAIRLNPNYTEAFYNRANIYHELNQRQEAIEDYTQAIRINPKDDDFYLQRGLVYYEIDNKQAAIEDYTQAVRLNPDNDLAYYNRGISRYDLGDKKAAIADYTTAIKLNSNSAFAYNNRGLTYYELNKKQAAMKDFNQAIRIDSNNDYAYYNRGNARYDLGKKRQALADYQKAISINPNNGDFYLRRGLVRSEFKNKSKAIADYQKAAELYKVQGRKDDYQEVLNRINKLKS